MLHCDICFGNILLSKLPVRVSLGAWFDAQGKRPDTFMEVQIKFQKEAPQLLQLPTISVPQSKARKMQSCEPRF